VGAEAGPLGNADPDVMAAIDLGWSMAELYAEVRPADLEPPLPPPDGPLPEVRPQARGERIRLHDDLPGLAALTEREQFGLLIDQVTAGVAKLGPRITAAGLPIPPRLRIRL
jgi:hypothetical protein